uniref:RPP21 protein n=1 Tax=Anser cygnoides TaxID=8845 RepID=A0A8B9IPF3_ANSCY
GGPPWGDKERAAHWVLPHSPALARFYCSTQRTAARRLACACEILGAPAVKRAVCRRCCSLLLGCQRLRGVCGPPHKAWGVNLGRGGGRNFGVRVPDFGTFPAPCPAGGGQPRTVLRCWACGHHRRLLCPPRPRPRRRDTPPGA